MRGSAWESRDACMCITESLRCTCKTNTALWIDYCCCSGAQLCLAWLWDLMDCSMPGFSVPHHLPKFAKVHVLCMGDAIQPSHPQMPSSPSALNFPSIRDFSNRSAVRIRWPTYWSFNFSISPSNEYSQLISLKDWLIWSPRCPRDSQASSLAPQFEGINSWRSAFFTVQFSQPYMTTGKTTALTT